MIRPFRQPSRTECVPACVYAVVRSLFGEESFSYEEIRAACRPDRRGCVHPIALAGLQRILDIEVLADASLAAIAEELDQSTPVVLFSRGSSGHAVVACGLSDAVLTLMDPEVGDFIAIEGDDLLLFEADIFEVWAIRP